MMSFLPWIIIFLAIWTIPWKGVALWKSARLNHWIWFVVFLVVNTLGILEILYIFIFSKRHREELLPVAVKKEVAGNSFYSVISFDEFQKLDLRAAKIIEAERVKGSEKLIKLKVDVGDEKRQIIAGIGKVYDSKDLVGREIIIVSNLEPRKLMGLESRGMLLAASSKEGPVLLVPDKEVCPGAKIS